MARASSGWSRLPAASHASDGRTMSAQIAAISAETSAATAGTGCPGGRGQSRASCHHAAAAVSAPLASQRCCQLPPS